jgi:hypothetical protein
LLSFRHEGRKLEVSTKKLKGNTAIRTRKSDGHVGNLEYLALKYLTTWYCTCRMAE